MPAHRIALKKLLEAIKRRISEDEARLLQCQDGDRERLIDEIAELKLRQTEIEEILSGGGE